jgi:hypothetical protein
MKGPLIGGFRNEWRQRTVQIFEDTENPDMVYTEGHRIAFHTCHIPGNSRPCPACTPGEAIHTHEPRELYTAYIGSYNKVFR